MAVIDFHIDKRFSYANGYEFGKVGGGGGRMDGEEGDGGGTLEG